MAERNLPLARAREVCLGPFLSLYKERIYHASGSSESPSARTHLHRSLSDPQKIGNGLSLSRPRVSRGEPDDIGANTARARTVARPTKALRHVEKGFRSPSVVLAVLGAPSGVAEAQHSVCAQVAIE